MRGVPRPGGGRDELREAPHRHRGNGRDVPGFPEGLVVAGELDKRPSEVGDVR
jgi:hypothetical protein